VLRTVILVLSLSLSFSFSIFVAACDENNEETVGKTSSEKPSGWKVEGIEPRKLVGTEWELSSIVGERPIQESNMALDFPNPGEFSGDASCKSFDTRYKINDKNLRFFDGGLRVVDFTELPSDCKETEALRDQGAEYIQEIQRVSSVTASPDLLKLRDSDGKVELSDGMEGLVSTAVRCPGSVNRQERAYFKALKTVSGYRLGADNLELVYSDGDATLLFNRRSE